MIIGTHKKLDMDGFSHDLMVGVFVLIFAIVGVAHIVAGRADQPNPGPATAALIATNCQPIWVSGNQMIFNKIQSNKHWNAYIGDVNCQNAMPLLPPVAGHLAAASVSTDGVYVLFEEDFGNPPGQSSAVPGRGVSNDLVLLNRQTGSVSRLTYGRLGTISAHLNSDGTMVTWSQMVKTPQASGSLKNYLLGIWQIHQAEITTKGTLANEKVWSQSNDQGFYETYGYYGSRIMFASDADVYPKSSVGNWFTSQDWLIDDGLSAGSTAVQVSQPLTNGGGKNTYDYHEFMAVAPTGTFIDTGPWILTSIDYQSSGGMDLWRMKTDGSGLERLTYFNGIKPRLLRQKVQGFPRPRYTVVGSVAIDPNNPKIIYANIIHNLGSSEVDDWKITIN